MEKVTRWCSGLRVEKSIKSAMNSRAERFQRLDLSDGVSGFWMKSSRMDSSGFSWGFSDECSLMRTRSDERQEGRMSGRDFIANLGRLLDRRSWVGAQTERGGRHQSKGKGHISSMIFAWGLLDRWSWEGGKEGVGW